MNVAEHLHDLVAFEPPYRLDPDAALAGGRRRRRARTATLSLVAAGTGAVLVGGVLALQPRQPSGQQTLFGAAPTVTPTPAPEPPSEYEQIVRAHTPASWTISAAHPLRHDAFQADVDDGKGASRLYIGVSASPGSLNQHPCADHEFASGGACKEIELDPDTRLVVRGPLERGVVVSAYAVIVHRDGSGVDVENDNATWPWIDRAITAPVTPEQGRALTAPSVNRPAPVYSMAQLIEIAKAVDAATSGR